MYATGCRCTPCRTANGKYRRARPKFVPTPDPALDAIIAAGNAAAAQLIADGDAVDVTLLSDDDRAMLEAFDELPTEGMLLALSKALRDAGP
jgi:hypothetical protein